MDIGKPFNAHTHTIIKQNVSTVNLVESIKIKNKYED